MRMLLLTDLKLGLADLLDHRTKAMEQTTAGRLYHPHLERIRRAIDALPRSVGRDLPLTQELAQTDLEHDDFGAALWHYTEAFLRAPGLDAAVRAAAERIRAAFIPSLSILRVSYASEAAAAAERRPQLEPLRADLDRFPLPAGQTLASWAEGFVERGEALLPLLTQRARMRAEQDAASRTSAGLLRSEALSMLMRLRSALADEFADRPDVGRDRDRDIFAFFDQLATARQTALRSRTSPDSEEPAAAAPAEAS